MQVEKTRHVLLLRWKLQECRRWSELSRLDLEVCDVRGGKSCAGSSRSFLHRIDRHASAGQSMDASVLEVGREYFHLWTTCFHNGDY